MLTTTPHHSTTHTTHLLHSPPEIRRHTLLITCRHILLYFAIFALHNGHLKGVAGLKGGRWMGKLEGKGGIGEQGTENQKVMIMTM